MPTHRPATWLLTMLCVLLSGAALAEQQVEAVAGVLGKPKDAVPPFDFGYRDGLYATVTLSKRLQTPDIEREKKVKLEDLPGFHDKLKLRVLWVCDEKDDKRIYKRPLAVPLLGLTGRDKDDLARLWQAMLHDAGCHVMSFDSVFSEEFGKRSRHGVAGNVAKEAEVAAQVIEHFLKHEDVAGKITEVRLLGTSYGGTIALQMAKREKEGRLPFRLGTVLALSPTVSLTRSAERLDRFYEEDFGKLEFNRMKLLKLRDREVVGPDAAVPFDASYMKAGIGYVFRNELKKIVEKNDKLYGLGLLERYERSGDPRGDAKNWGFRQYLDEMCFPYWREHGGPQSLEAFTAEGDLRTLIPACPPSALTILTADDPLNDPADLADLQSKVNGDSLVVAPHGGHLGYAQSDWTYKLVTTLFHAEGHEEAPRTKD